MRTCKLLTFCGLFLLLGACGGPVSNPEQATPQNELHSRLLGFWVAAPDNKTAYASAYFTPDHILIIYQEEEGDKVREIRMPFDHADAFKFYSAPDDDGTGYLFSRCPDRNVWLLNIEVPSREYRLREIQLMRHQEG